MNKEELIELKEELLNSKKKYTKVFIDGMIHQSVSMEPGEDISYSRIKEDYSSINNPEEEACLYLEKKVEEIIRNATLKDIDFDGISIPMFFRYYVEKDLSDQIDFHCCLDASKFHQEKVLDRFVEVSFNYDFINSNHMNMGAETFLNSQYEPYGTSFVVDYDKFSKALMTRGFEVTNSTFDDILNSSMDGNDSRIVVDLRKEKQKVR